LIPEYEWRVYAHMLSKLLIV